MNEFGKRARMLSDGVPKLGILQEITNYLDWFFATTQLPLVLLCNWRGQLGSLVLSAYKWVSA